MNELLKRYGEVQLATLVDVPSEGGDWLHEIKFDGYWLLAFLEKAQIKLFTRKRNDWTARFPSIRDSVARLKVQSAVLDIWKRLSQSRLAGVASTPCNRP
jgi:bifunctional non-homologous end joining protein LigD